MWSSLRRFWLFDDPRSYGARAILRGAAEGLRANGKQVRVYPFDPTAPDGIEWLRNDLLRFQPDGILLANHPASLFFRQIGLSAYPARILIWLFDDPFLMGDEPFSADEIVLAADPAFIIGAHARGAQRIFFLPVAAPQTVLPEPQAKYTFPLAYVGATSNLDMQSQPLSPELLDYFNRIIAEKIQSPALSFAHLLTQHPLSPGKQVNLSGRLAYYLYAEANRRSRLRFLEPLAEMGLKLFGNTEWIAQIRGTPLEKCYQGPLDPFVEYPALICSVGINCNLRSLQGFVVPTQRDFLVPQIGGFLLSTQISGTNFDWKAVDPTNRFRLADFPWSPAASTPEAFAALVAQYLSDTQLRIDWTENAARIINGQHTFAHRMEQLGALWDAAGI